MIDLGYGLRLQRPISVWNRPLSADFRQLFRDLAKAAIHVSRGGWVRAAIGAADSLKAVGLAGQDPAGLAYLLIRRALTFTLFELTREVSTFFDSNKGSFERIADQLDLAFEETELEIDGRFLDHPRELSILPLIRKPFGEFLVGLGVAEIKARSVAERLDTYFVLALHSEWNRRRDDYQPILAALRDSPFARASERERQWMQYRACLDRRLDEPVFREGFCLREVYVPLRAYWEESKVDGKQFESCRGGCEGEAVRHAVDLDYNLTSWIDAADPQDAMRVISGGPGAGKTSFLKIFAANMARRSDLRVVFIPLYHLEPRKDLPRALEDFGFQDRFLPDRLLDPSSDERLLVILDGLDELAVRGAASEEVVRSFVKVIKRTIDSLNVRGLRIQVILSGRELTIQTHQSILGSGPRILHLLGYLVGNPEDFEAEKCLAEVIEVDQRHIYWRKFGEATGLDFDGLPSSLSGDQLGEITSQPLLNYFLALSYVRRSFDLSEDSFLSQLYGELMFLICDREWDRRKNQSEIDKLSKSEFTRALEDVALAMWHGDRGRATVRGIQDALRCAPLRKIRDFCEEQSEDGLRQLLTAFYFRQCDTGLVDEAIFEFSHKGFEGYLTARRIERQILLVDRGLLLYGDGAEGGLTVQEALICWAKVCGPAAIDDGLLGFLHAEVALRGPSVCAGRQRSMIRLIQHTLRCGMPISALNQSNFREMKRQSRNAEEALLACHSACAWVTEEVCDIHWPSKTAVREWIQELCSQREGQNHEIVLRCLNHLSFEGQNLDLIDLYRQGLVGARLDGARLEDASLDGARLDGVKFDGAKLNGARLSGARLSGARLYEATLDGASLEGARLDGVMVNDKTSFVGIRGVPSSASIEVSKRIARDSSG